MFSRALVNSGEFLDMSAEARALYLQLNMLADDLGIIGNVKRNLAYVGANNKDLEELINNDYILKLEDNKSKPAIVIKHWFINNTQQSDRVEQTIYTDILQKLYIDSAKTYTTDASQDDTSAHPIYFKNMCVSTPGNKTETKRKQNVSNLIHQERKEVSKKVITSLCGGKSEDFTTHNGSKNKKTNIAKLEEEAPAWFMEMEAEEKGAQ